MLAVAALLSNAGFFLAIPGQRALAWLGVILVIAAIVCAVIGIMRWTNFTEDIRIRAKADEMLAAAKGMK
ncbi:MAG TPA: hypothetical protein VGH51_14700 [Candidatus Angelobacter sp.]